jgi:hypothetical protein
LGEGETQPFLAQPTLRFARGFPYP